MILNTVQENWIKEFFKSADKTKLYNDLYFGDLMTLNGNNWVNDNVIDKYFGLIVERSEKNVHAFSSHFFPKLKKDGYKSVARWTKEICLFSFKLILVPICFNYHWTLAIIDMGKKEIKHFDSLNGFNKECLEVLLDYLQNEIDQKAPILKSVKWKLTKAKHFPQQLNNHDCGVFICKYADHLSLNQKMSFNQTQMPLFRKAIMWEIINKKLLNQK
jgi:sentrin-specific protease 1